LKKSMNTVFIGADARSAFAAEYLDLAGHEVGYCKCQCRMPASAVRIESIGDALGFADAVVLPIPVTRDGKELLYSEGVLLSQIAENLPFDKKMLFFGGMIPDFWQEELESLGVKTVDYSKNEQYLQNSAELTARAFLDFLNDKDLPSLENSKVAICGLGRIGKCLTRHLGRLNAQINVLSGRADALRESYPRNISFFDYRDACDALSDRDAVINTAPSHVLGMVAVKSLPKTATFYELASSPFGIEKSCAKYLGDRYVKALGLPGIYYPKESGELIAKSVLSALDEEVMR